MRNGQYTLSSESIGSAFCKLALPAVLTTMISTIYNLTDTFFIGQTNSAAMLSAVSVAMPYTWIVPIVYEFISIGTATLLPILQGKGEKESSDTCRAFCLWASLLLGLIAIPFARMLIKHTLPLLTMDSAVQEYTRQYLGILYGIAPLWALSAALQSLLRAQGLSVKAGIVSAVGVAVNIVLDPILILRCDMGVRGAALATDVGAIASLLLALVFQPKKGFSRPRLPRRQDMRQIALMALPSVCSSIITALTVSLSFNQILEDGNTITAAVSVGSRVYAVVVTLLSAIAYSLSPLYGYCHGAGNTKRLKQAFGFSLAVCTGISGIGTALFLTKGEWLMRIFTQDEGIVEMGVTMLRYLSLGLIACAVQMNAMSCMSGTGKAIPTLVIGLMRQVVILMPLMVILKKVYGLHGLMLAYPVTDIVSAIPAAIICLHANKKQDCRPERKQQSESDI